MRSLEERRAARLRWLAIPLIVWIAGGCDNVQWGGLDVRVVESRRAAEETPAPAPEPTGLVLPEGPILHVGSGGDTVSLVPLVELDGRALRPIFPPDDPLPTSRALAETRYSPGARLLLLADGVRVGSGYAGRVDPVDSAYCPPRPAVPVAVELVRDASDVRRFLALPPEAETVPGRPEGEPPDPVSGVHRLAAFEIASAEVRRRGVPWPPDWIRARKDLRTIRLREGGETAFVTTYLHRDELDTSPPGDDAYSLFVVARPAGEGFEPVFLSFREYRETGKSAPRLHTSADLDGDGIRELVLEIFREGVRSFAVLGFRNGGWRLLHEDPCTPAAPPGTGPDTGSPPPGSG